MAIIDNSAGLLSRNRDSSPAPLTQDAGQVPGPLCGSSSPDCGNTGSIYKLTQTGLASNSSGASILDKSVTNPHHFDHLMAEILF